MAAVIGMAQDTPPAEPAADPEQSVEEVAPRKLWNWITLGYTGWQPRGDRRTIRSLATPPEGFTIRELNVMSPGSDKVPYARLVFRGMLDQDSFAQGYAILNQGKTVVQAQRAEASFFERALTPAGESRDRETSVTLSHAIAPNIGAFVKYREDSQSHPYEPPRVADRNRSRTLAGGIEGNVLGGHASLTVGDHRFYDASGTQPDTLQRRLDASYSINVAPTLSLEGNAGLVKIEQAGRPNGHIRTWAMSGTWDFSPSTELHFHLGRQDRDLDAVQNAYVKAYFTSSARLVHRWGNNWSAQLGYRRAEAERLRADQSFVDVPKWNLWDARISGRLWNGMRLAVKGSWEAKAGNAVMLTTDPRSMLWNDKASGEIRLSGGNEVLNGYASYAYKFRRNANRGIEVRYQNLALGGSYAFSPSLLGYLEFARDAYQVAGGTETGVILGDFFSESISFAAGVDWTVGPSDSLSASANYYETNNERGFRLTGQYRRQLSPHQAISVFFAPWRLDDRLYGRADYRTTLFGVDYTLRF